MLLHLHGLGRHEEFRDVLFGMVPAMFLGVQLQLSIMPHFYQVFGSFLLLATEVQRQQQSHLRSEVSNLMTEGSVMFLVLSTDVVYGDHYFSMYRIVDNKEGIRRVYSQWLLWSFSCLRISTSLTA